MRLKAIITQTSLTPTMKYIGKHEVLINVQMTGRKGRHKKKRRQDGTSNAQIGSRTRFQNGKAPDFPPINGTVEAGAVGWSMKFLSTYSPLIVNKRGWSVVKERGVPPYVDSSCRREPDFGSELPSISALCRASKFAPRLNKSDVVVYLTFKGAYRGHPGRHWRLTGVLKVIERFESHRDAAKWYVDKGLQLPSNCIVPENPPLSLDETSNPSNYPSVERWDAGYRARTRKFGVFLACESLFLELHDPPVVTQEMMYAAFGRVPGTRTPPKISDQEFERLIAVAGVTIAPCQ